MSHDGFSRNTRNQVFDALRELMTPPDPPKRPVGFINPEDKGKKTSGARGNAWHERLVRRSAAAP